MGLGLGFDGLLGLSWILAQILGLFWAWIKGFRVYRDLLEEVLGSLAFRAHVFSSSGFRRGPQTESIYSLPLVFRKLNF